MHCLHDEAEKAERGQIKVCPCSWGSVGASKSQITAIQWKTKEVKSEYSVLRVQGEVEEV